MIRDLKSNIKVLKAMFAAISTDTTTTGEIIDTAGYKSMTLVLTPVVYSRGTLTPIVYESEDSGMSGASAVADGNMIPNSGGEAAAVINAANEIHTIGLFGTMRYIRLSIVSSDTASATICALAIMEAENDPVTQSSQA